MMCERDALQRKIDIISFHMDETRLFLDTHPCDKEAICYFEKLHKMRCELMNEYVAKFGPVSAYQYKQSDSWLWAEGPQPWEKGGNS